MECQKVRVRLPACLPACCPTACLCVPACLLFVCLSVCLGVHVNDVQRYSVCVSDHVHVCL
jgi:hypothetical protein